MGREVEEEPTAVKRRPPFDLSGKNSAHRRFTVPAHSRHWPALGDRSAATVFYGTVHSWRRAAPREGPPGECGHSRQMRLRHCSVRQSPRS